MARKKTIGQARELARQSANFFRVPYTVYLVPGGEPGVVRKSEFSDEFHAAHGAHVEVYEPAEERPNELDRRELAAVLAGLYLLDLNLGCLGQTATGILTGKGKHNPLTRTEIDQLAARLMATR